MRAGDAIHRGWLLRTSLVAMATLGFVSASAGPQSQAGFLWIVESQGILNLATDDGSIRFEIPHHLGTSAVAVNDINGELWAYGNKRLYHYSRFGQLLFEIDTPPSTHGGEPKDIVVDATSGNLWLAVMRNLYRFDLQGRLQQTIILPREAVAMSLDRSRSVLWVAMPQELRTYDIEGLGGSKVVLGSKEFVQDLAYDRRLDQLWVGLAERLRRYDADGRPVFEKSGNFTGALSPDGAGGLWLARVREIHHFDELGISTFSAEPFVGDPDKSVVDLAVDPLDASVWIASQRRIKHYAADGQLVHQLTPGLGDGVIRHLRRASFYADLDAPEIEITQPIGGIFLNNNRPAIELHYFDLGVGVDTTTIKVSVDGVAIAAPCESSAASAKCVPALALPEGELRLIATVADLVGNIAETDERRITIDTIAPEITIAESPADHITNQPALILAGRLNEPSILAINGNPIALNGDFGFTHSVQLAEGSNTFELIATDRAGNVAIERVFVALDTIPPAAPSAGLITVGESSSGQATVTGAAGSVEANGKVRITNSRTGKSVTVVAGPDGAYVAVVEADPGDELTVTVLDAAGNVSDAILAQVPSTAGLQIVEPADGASIEGPSVLVVGTLAGPLNTAITINGAPVTAALVDGVLRFYASISLQNGPNPIIAVANFQNGAKQTRQITVNRVSVPYTVEVTQVAFLPQPVRFSVVGARPRDRIQFDFDGNGTLDLLLGGSFDGPSAPVLGSHFYPAPGVYRPKVEILRFNSALGRHELAYEQIYTVAVFGAEHSKQHLDLVLRSVWDGMFSALLAGDIARALGYMSPSSRDTYGQIFEALRPRIQDVVSETSRIEPIALSDGIADYAVLNVHSGESRVFIINFLQGSDGIWRIDSL